LALHWATTTKETPSLDPLLNGPDWCDGVWAGAVTLAVSETGLRALLEACPWPLADVLADGWLPA
jgi:hypothetical protein